MKILHYFLGFPPYRSGGLTRFAMDLMCTQVKNGDEVFALWPGRIRLFSNKISIKEKKLKSGIISCELINPLPICYDEGVKNPELFFRECSNIGSFEAFIEKNKIDVVHIHTFMGLYSECLDYLKRKGIKTIFTVHDYYPLCFRTYLFHQGRDCAEKHSIEECAADCASGLSYGKMVFLQSVMYRKLKDTFFVKFLRLKHRRKIVDGYGSVKRQVKSLSELKLKRYKQLNAYYKEMLNKIDLIHFGSSVARDVYSKYTSLKNVVIIPISNSRIIQREKIEKTKSNNLRIGYLADRKEIKGFTALIAALDRIEAKEPGRFELYLFGEPVKRKYVVNLGSSFHDKDLYDYYRKIDILIVPSQWHETFGLTAAEALSYWTPVVVGKNVGAKDVIGRGGVILGGDGADNIVKSIRGIINGEGEEIKKGFQNSKLVFWPDFVKKMYDIYRSKS